MDLAKLCPWNWFRKPAARPAGLVVRRLDEPDIPPDSPDALGYELDRLFDHAFSGFGFDAPHLQAAMDGEAHGRHFLPRAETSEGPEAYTILVDLPGVLEPDIELTLCGRRLRVLAQRRAPLPGGQPPDPDRGAFRRVFQLPPDADPAAIRAVCLGCRLVLTLPRQPAISEKQE